MVPTKRAAAQAGQVGGTRHWHCLSAAYRQLSHHIGMRRRRSATDGRRDQSARCRAGSPSGFRQTRYGGDPVVQFPCTSHTPSIVDRSGTDTGLQSDPDETGLLQLGTPGALCKNVIWGGTSLPPLPSFPPPSFPFP